MENAVNKEKLEELVYHGDSEGIFNLIKKVILFQGNLEELNTFSKQKYKFISFDEPQTYVEGMLFRDKDSLNWPNFKQDIRSQAILKGGSALIYFSFIINDDKMYRYYLGTPVKVSDEKFITK